MLRSVNTEQLAPAYELWVGSWEAALLAVSTASEIRTISKSEAAAHKAGIAAEREIVRYEFKLLVVRPAVTLARDTSENRDPALTQSRSPL